MQFGRLNKLRYLDLKGNTLVPTLAKIVGPCLTSKDCMDAAKKVIPFSVGLEKKLEAEKKKQEAAEAKRKEEEVNLIKEQIRLAKKAARKERVMRERQQKAEEHAEEEESDETEAKTTVKSTKDTKPSTESRSFLSFLASFVFVAIILALFLVASFRFLPEQSEKALSLLSEKQRELVRFAVEMIEGSFIGIYQKVLSLYKV